MSYIRSDVVIQHDALQAVSHDVSNFVKVRRAVMTSKHHTRMRQKNVGFDGQVGSCESDIGSDARQL